MDCLLRNETPSKPWYVECFLAKPLFSHAPPVIAEPVHGRYHGMKKNRLGLFAVVYWHDGNPSPQRVSS